MAEFNPLNQTGTTQVSEFTFLETLLITGVLALTMMLTVVGNALVCYVVLRNKRLWTEMNMFLVNLALGDMAVGLLCMIFPLLTAIKREWIFGHGILCKLNATCNSVLFCSTIFTHTIISIDRYFAIVHPMKKTMTRKKAILMIFGTWIFSAIIVLGPLFGWGHMEYNRSTLQCGYGFPRSKIESIYILTLALIAFAIPVIIMTYLYTRIYIAVCKHTRRMSMTVSGLQHQTAFQTQKRIVLTFFLALLAFVVCWSPFFCFIAFAVSVKDRSSIPHGLGLAAYVCGFLNSACNPFIVGLRNEQFKIAFRKILSCCCCCVCEDKTDSLDDDSKKSVVVKTSRTLSTRTTDSDQFRNNGNIVKRDESLITESGNQETDDSEQALTLPKKHKVKMVKPRKRSLQTENTGSPVAYKRFLHVLGGTSWSESAV